MRRTVVLLAFLLATPLFALFKAPVLPLHFDAPHMRPNAGVRPLRDGGIRLELEMRNGVLFVHNYGHGGAGLTLSWGSAEESIDLADSYLRAANQVVIVGGGVIGMTTAWALLQRGYEVTIYSDTFFPDNVSSVAGGLWSPVSIDLSDDRPGAVEKAQRIQVQSYKRFAALEQAGWPVRRMPFFVTEEAKQSGKSGIETFEALPQLFRVQAHRQLPIEGVSVGGYELQTFLIDTPVYGARLKAELVKKGVRFVQRKFASQDDIVASVGAGTVVFHATGLGARETAGDGNVVPVHGDLLYAEAHVGFDPGALGYMAFYGDTGTDYMFARSGEAVLGGTFERGNDSLIANPAECARILASARRFFGK